MPSKSDLFSSYGNTIQQPKKPSIKQTYVPSNSVGTPLNQLNAPKLPAPTISINDAVNLNPLKSPSTQLANNQANAQSTATKSLTVDEIAKQKLLNEQSQYLNQPANYSINSDTKKMATLIDPSTQDRKAVEVGSQDAQNLFGKGYILEKSGGKTVIPGQTPLQTSIPAQTNQPSPPTQAASTQPAQPDRTQTQIDELRGLIIGALTPGQREQQVQQNLNDLITGTNVNAANLEGQGRGLTSSQVTGQQGALFRAAEAAKMPLEAELSRLESARQAAIQAGNTQLGFLYEDQKNKLAQEALTRQDQQAVQQQLQTLALTAAQSGATPEELQAILNAPDFNSALQAASPFLQQQESIKPVALSEGQRLVNPVTGEVIVDATKATKSELDELLSISDAQALGVPFGTTKGAAFGITPSSEKSKTLSAESAKLVANAKSGLDALNIIRQYSEERLGKGSLLNNKYKAAETDLIDVIGRLRSGGAITEDEEKRFSDLLPKTFELESTRQFKLDRIERLLNDVISGIQPQQNQSNQNYGSVDDYLDNSPAFSNDLSKSINGSVQIPQSSRLAYINNNPGNLRFAGQAGATQGEGGFAKFSSPQAGYQALLNQINLDSSRGLTLAQFINKYAPPIENNTNQYLSQISQSLGVDPNTLISKININKLGQAMALKESSTRIV